VRQAELALVAEVDEVVEDLPGELLGVAVDLRDVESLKENVEGRAEREAASASVQMSAIRVSSSARLFASVTLTGRPTAAITVSFLRRRLGGGVGRRRAPAAPPVPER